MALTMSNTPRKRFLRQVFGWPPPVRDPPRETAWLDGVRGLAAFLVLMNHYSLEWLTMFAYAPFGARATSNQNPDLVWYHEEGEQLWEIWRLPFLRLIMCSGTAQVAVFFVLSGFVLSWSPLKALRSNQYEKMASSIGSSTIRRWFRLYLPCFIVSIPYLIHHIVEADQPVASAFGEIWLFLKATETWANPFVTDHIQQFTAGHPYNYVMWTIPFEFAGSIFVYVTILGLGRIQEYRRRTTAVIFVSLYALCSMFWGYWLFGTGLVLADYVQQVGGFKKLSQRTGMRACYAWMALFILGLLLMGWMKPFPWFTRPGYSWMDRIPLPSKYREHDDEDRFWHGWAAIFVIASACHLSFIRAFFEFSLMQHLGRISFMLYLIHLLVHRVVTKPFRSYLYKIICTRTFSNVYNGDIYVTTPIQNIAIYCILLTVGVLIVAVLAHFLEVYVDGPCTRLGKILDEKLVNGFWDVKIAVKDDEEQLLRPITNADIETTDMIQR